MLKKKILTLLMVGVIALSATGCGNKVGDIELTSGQTAIYISDDGTVSYGVSDSFEKDYYDKGDLKQEIEDEVDAFNSSDSASKSDAVKVKEAKVSKKVATMILEFATVGDFSSYILKYNNPDNGTFYIGKISDNEDCKLSGKFYEPGKKDKLVSEDKIEGMDANILVVNEKMSVQVDGTIKYVSENCSVKDGVVTTAEIEKGNSYIIYTK